MAARNGEILDGRPAELGELSAQGCFSCLLVPPKADPWSVVTEAERRAQGVRSQDSEVRDQGSRERLDAGRPFIRIFTN
jgi:hypothetical protein